MWRQNVVRLLLKRGCLSPIFKQAGLTAQKTHCVHYDDQSVSVFRENKRQTSPCAQLRSTPGRCEGNRGTAPCILSIGGNLWCAVGFTSRSFTLGRFLVITTGSEAGWVSQHRRSLWRTKNPCSRQETNLDSRVLQQLSYYAS